MVEVACRTPVPVGSIAWPGYHAAATLIVKATFDLRADGSVTLCHEQRPLSLDVRAADGTLVYPNDFAPHKMFVDVVVVGEEARSTASDAALGLGALRVTSPRLGPIAAHDPREAVWSKAGFDLARFQTAPPAQRVARAVFPAELAYVHDSVMLRQSVDFPAPSLAIVESGREDWSSDDALHVPLVCDTVLFDPRARTVTLLHRGFAELRQGFGPSTLVLVNPFGRLAGVGPGDIASWPRAPLSRFEELGRSSAALVSAIEEAEPSTVEDGRVPPSRRGANTESPRSAVVAASPGAVPSMRRPAHTQPMSVDEMARALEDTRRPAQGSDPGYVAPAPAAPAASFRAASDPPPKSTVAMPAGLAGGTGAPPFQSKSAAGGRERATVSAPPPAPRFGAPPSVASGPPSQPFVHTQAVPAYIRQEALPFVQGHFEPKSSPGATTSDGDRASNEGDVGTGTLPFQRPSPLQAMVQALSAATTRSAQGGATLTTDQIRAIRDELAAKPAARAEILGRHGLSELAWRAISGIGTNV